MLHVLKEFFIMKTMLCRPRRLTLQEGQHPLTGQRAANFRLSFL